MQEAGNTPHITQEVPRPSELGASTTDLAISTRENAMECLTCFMPDKLEVLPIVIILGLALAVSKQVNQYRENTFSKSCPLKISLVYSQQAQFLFFWVGREVK